MFSPLSGRMDLIQHCMEMRPGVALRSWPYRLPEHKRKVVQEELAAMLEMGVIEESMSAWCIRVDEVLIGWEWLAFHNTGFDYWLGMYIDKDLAIPMLYRFLFIDPFFYRFSYRFPNRLKNK